MRHEQMKQNKTKQTKINKAHHTDLETCKWSSQYPYPLPLEKLGKKYTIF